MDGTNELMRAAWTAVAVARIGDWNCQLTTATTRQGHCPEAVCPPQTRLRLALLLNLCSPMGFLA